MGLFFYSRKGNNLAYPTIEISTTSKPLAFQLKEILSKEFRIGFRSFKPGDYRTIYRISLNGYKMTSKWIKDIGFSNDRHKKKIRVGLQGFEP